MTTNTSEGDTVILPTKTSIILTKPGEENPRKMDGFLARAESTPAARKRHLDSSSPKAEIPRKSPRRGEPLADDLDDRKQKAEVTRNGEIIQVVQNLERTESRPEVPRDKNTTKRQTAEFSCKALKRPSEDLPDVEKPSRKSRSDVVVSVVDITKDIQSLNNYESNGIVQKVQIHHQHELPKRNEAVKLRKTIQWLEEGARRMREDLAMTRAELHEERRAARLAKRELDSAVRDAKVGEAARHLQIISELKSRLAQSPTRQSVDSVSAGYSKSDFLKVENHRRELSALRKRLAEAEATVQKLKTNACGPHGSGKRRKVENPDDRKLQFQIQSLRTANKKLEERLQVVTEAEKKRVGELRIQHENHEAQLTVLQRTLRSDTIKMMDEIRSKTREIEKLEKLVAESSQMHKKLQSKEDDLMRKLRETERSHQIRLAPRIEEKISSSGDHVESLCNGDCDAAAEVERLREISVEQQEIIEVLRQAVKEKERKLDQLSNKKRKEEFYKQWLELEPVVEVEDEDEHEHEEGDSALSSAPSSLSPQPGGCGQWQHTGVTREAYETVLLEVEELQTRLVEEQRELAHAKSQVRDLEKALLQETRGSQNSRRALSDKLREIEEREAALVAEISELREQNELLEFRVLELEETPCLRDTPDPADSGIVSPEPIHLYKDQLIKQRDRAVATVIPYNTYNNSVSPIPQKPPLSLQESGIFDEEDEAEVELASCGTQTETPAGDLLQEVQRLHELRARIQERAVKVPVPIIDTKLYSVPDVNDVIEAGQTSSYQERIRELEERLHAHEEAENKRIQEKRLSKQREEDLLDENYRLTERIYWFENLLRNSKNSDGACKIDEISSNLEGNCQSNTDEDSRTEKLDSETSKLQTAVSGDSDLEESSEASFSDAKSNQDEEIIVEESKDEKNKVGEHFQISSSPNSSVSEKLGESSKLTMETESFAECGKMGTEIIGRLEELVKVEVSTKQRIVDLERREATYMKTLQKADETWVQTERNYSIQLKELRAKLEVELSSNEKLARRATELENKLKELETCQDGVSEQHEKDPHRQNIRGNNCQATTKSRIFTPMEVDESSDVVDGKLVKPDQTSTAILLHRNEENNDKSCPQVNRNTKLRREGSQTEYEKVVCEETIHSAQNSFPSSVSVVNLTLEHDANRMIEDAKSLVPEILDELATEAKEEDLSTKGLEKGVEITGDEKIVGVGKAEEEVAEEVKESPDELGKEDIGVDVAAGEEEPVVTIKETEPEKKIIYFRWR